MKVWRVENKKGIGPYQDQSWPGYYNLSAAHSLDGDHPSPWYDGIGIRDDEFCGFLDLEQLQRWFHGFLDDLLKVGFQVVCYDVHPADIRVGKSQVVFKKVSQ